MNYKKVIDNQIKFLEEQQKASEKIISSSCMCEISETIANLASIAANLPVCLNDLEIVQEVPVQGQSIKFIPEDSNKKHYEEGKKTCVEVPLHGAAGKSEDIFKNNNETAPEVPVQEQLINKKQIASNIINILIDGKVLNDEANTILDQVKKLIPTYYQFM
ncbi:MAG: hypothetical protein AB6733_12350 [Clostridiaceae bacterium]